MLLSLFPGIGLLDRAFEECGFCVVRGPDLLWGGDVRRFNPPLGAFAGIIGGPPCQDFSRARRVEATGDGVEMFRQFARVVVAAEPDWFLAENVPCVPDLRVEGYEVQRIDVEQAWYVPVRRHRTFQFGRHSRILERSQPLDIPRGREISPAEDCVLASDSRPFEVVKRLQGLPEDFELPGFSDVGRRRAVGNGVALPLGRVVARAVCLAIGHTVPPASSRDAHRCVTGGDRESHEVLDGVSQREFGPLTLPRCAVCQVVVPGGKRTCSDRCRQVLSRGKRGLMSRAQVEAVLE